MMIGSRAAGAILALALAGPGAMAQAATDPLPPAVAKLIDCRAVTDGAARLACYDAQVDVLAQATARSEIVVLDKEALKKTRRSLFGFSLPPLPFFRGQDGDRNEADEPMNAIEATIGSARPLGYGKWMFVLDDGARWQTTETIGMMRDPKAGQSIRIEKGALGSYVAKVEGGRAVRVMRVN